MKKRFMGCSAKGRPERFPPCSTCTPVFWVFHLNTFVGFRVRVESLLLTLPNATSRMAPIVSSIIQSFGKPVFSCFFSDFPFHLFLKFFFSVLLFILWIESIGMKTQLNCWCESEWFGECYNSTGLMFVMIGKSISGKISLISES